MRKVGAVLFAIGAVLMGYHIGYTDCKMHVAENLIDNLMANQKKEDVTNATIDAAAKIVK